MTAGTARTTPIWSGARLSRNATTRRSAVCLAAKTRRLLITGERQQDLASRVRVLTPQDVGARA